MKKVKWDHKMNTLVHCALEGAKDLPSEKKADFFDALAHLLPDPQAETAKSTAHLLRLAEHKQQELHLSFSR